MTLTEAEAGLLALLLIARHIEDAESWLLWEDVPELDEDSYDLLLAATLAEADLMRARLADQETRTGIDARHLLAEAS